MSQFVAGSGLSFRQYLQAQSFVDDIQWSISENALRVGASVDALSDRGVKIEGAVSRVSDGLDRIEHEVDETNLNLLQMDNTLRQGFVTLHFDLENVVQSLTDMWRSHIDSKAMGAIAHAAAVKVLQAELF